MCVCLIYSVSGLIDAIAIAVNRLAGVLVVGMSHPSDIIIPCLVTSRPLPFPVGIALGPTGD